MDLTINELTARMTASSGTPVCVTWSFRLSQLVCTRADGEPLTPDMETRFDRLLQATQPASVR